MMESQFSLTTNIQYHHADIIHSAFNSDDRGELLESHDRFMEEWGYLGNKHKKKLIEIGVDPSSFITPSRLSEFISESFKVKKNQSSVVRFIEGELFIVLLVSNPKLDELPYILDKEPNHFSVIENKSYRRYDLRSIETTYANLLITGKNYCSSTDIKTYFIGIHFSILRLETFMRYYRNCQFWVVEPILLETEKDRLKERGVDLADIKENLQNCKKILKHLSEQHPTRIHIVDNSRFRNLEYAFNLVNFLDMNKLPFAVKRCEAMIFSERSASSFAKQENNFFLRKSYLNEYNKFLRSYEFKTTNEVCIKHTDEI